MTELVGDLATEVATLVKQELALAAAEMERKARDAATNLWRMAIGAALGVVGLLVVAGTLVLALGTLIPLPLASGAIAHLVCLVAYAVFRSGSRSLHAMSIMPTETFASLRDDRLWAKEQIASTREQMSATMGEVRRRLKRVAPPRRKRTPAKKKRPTE